MYFLIHWEKKVAIHEGIKKFVIVDPESGDSKSYWTSFGFNYDVHKIKPLDRNRLFLFGVFDSSTLQSCTIVGKLRLRGNSMTLKPIKKISLSLLYCTKHLLGKQANLLNFSNLELPNICSVKKNYYQMQKVLHAKSLPFWNITDVYYVMKSYHRK